jgi:predicted nucleotidyltransferase
MVEERTRKVIEDLRAALESNGISVKKLVLYGSRSRDSTDRFSDIDLVIVSTDFCGKDYWERVQIVSPLIPRSAYAVEPLLVTPQEWEEESSMIIAIASSEGVEV